MEDQGATEVNLKFVGRTHFSYKYKLKIKFCNLHICFCCRATSGRTMRLWQAGWRAKLTPLTPLLQEIWVL